MTRGVLEERGVAKGFPSRWEPLDGTKDARAKLSLAGFVPRACMAWLRKVGHRWGRRPPRRKPAAGTARQPAAGRSN